MNIDTLLDDATRVAAFGIRSGTLKDDSPLYLAVENAEKSRLAGTLTWATPEATALAKALSEATGAIAPVTLIDLNSGWDPFAKPNPPAAGAAPPGRFDRLKASLSKGKLQFACLVATVLLIYAAGYYTIWHGRATALLEFGLADSIETQDIAVRKLMLPLLVALPPDSGPLHAASTSDSAKSAVLMQTAATAAEAARLTLLLDSVGEVQKLEEAIDQYQIRFRELYRDRIIGRGQYLDLRSHWSKPDGKPALDFKARRTAVSQSCTPEIQSAVQSAFMTSDPVGMSDAASGLVDLAAIKDCLLKALDVSPPTPATGDWEEQRYAFEHAMTIVGTWVLPAIYGALGALVYYMRQFMNPLRRDPSGTRVIMRVSLGALAGILLAWFWTTTTVSDTLTVPNIGLGTLAFAFIIGFSIEVFFGFLDRSVQLANDSVRQMGSGNKVE